MSSSREANLSNVMDIESTFAGAIEKILFLRNQVASVCDDTFQQVARARST